MSKFPLGAHMWPVIDGPHAGQKLASLNHKIYVMQLVKPMPNSAASRSPRYERLVYQLFAVSDELFVWSIQPELLIKPWVLRYD
jgi:hypothetical protein